MIPWLAKTDQNKVFPNNTTFDTPEQQEEVSGKQQEVLLVRLEDCRHWSLHSPPASTRNLPPVSRTNRLCSCHHPTPAYCSTCANG